jgi:multiple sugar transport system substrate-binding protein
MIDRRSMLKSTGASAALLALGGLSSNVARAATTFRFATPEADPGQIKAWESIFAAYKTASGNTVQPEYGLWDDLVKKVAADLIAGQPPAVIAGGSKPGFVVDLAKRNLVVDLTKLVDEIGRSDFDEKGLSDWQFNKQQVSIPYGQQWPVLWCRTDLFGEAGVKIPETWDDYMAVAEKLHKPDKGIYAAVFPAGRTWNTHIQCLHHIWSAGGFFFDEKLNVVLDSPETVRAVKYYTDMVKRFSPPDAGSYGFREASATYVTGRAATTMYWGRTLTHLYQQAPQLLKVSETTQIPRDKQFRTALAYDEFSVMRGPAQDAAVELVRFMLGDADRMFELMKPVMGHVIPTRKSVIPKLNEHEWIRDNPKIAKTLITPNPNAVADTYEGPDRPFNYKMDTMISRNIIQDMVQRVVIGGEAVEKSVTTAHKTAADIAKGIRG